MESNTIVMTTSRHEHMWILAPVAGTFQGIAVPTSGLKRRPRSAALGYAALGTAALGFAALGMDLRHRTP